MFRLITTIIFCLFLSQGSSQQTISLSDVIISDSVGYVNITDTIVYYQGFKQGLPNKNYLGKKLVQDGFSSYEMYWHGFHYDTISEPIYQFAYKDGLTYHWTGAEWIINNSCNLTDATFTSVPDGDDTDGNESGDYTFDTTIENWSISSSFSNTSGTVLDFGSSPQGGIYFRYDGNSSWDLSATFTISGSSQITFYGNMGTNDGLQAKFGSYTLSWVGGSGDAIIYDPLNQTNYNDGDSFSNGDTFTQNSPMPNNTLDWFVIFPEGVSEFTIFAQGGGAKEGFRFSTSQCEYNPE